MKLEKLFKVENNRLYYIEGNKELLLSKGILKAEDCKAAALPSDLSRLLLIELPWTKVGCDESDYNEEFLASFRDFLKELESKGAYAAIIPLADRQPSDGEKEAFTASFKHCARRIKDCASVAGFAVPDVVDADTFIEELSQKHGQYVFFSSNPVLLENSKIVSLTC